MVGLADELGRRLHEALAQLVHGVGDVGPSRGGRVHEAADARLHFSHELGIERLGLREARVNVDEEVLGVRQRVALGLGDRAFGKEPVHHLLDVLLLVELDGAIVVVLDLDAEQVGHLALVGDVPTSGQLVHELVVIATLGAAAVVVEVDRVDDLQVIDIDTDDHDLAVGALACEDAVVRVVKLLEALLDDPREEFPLEASPGLLYAVDGFLDLGDERSPALVELRVPDRKVTEDGLAFDKLSLQVSCHEVDAPHSAPVARRVSEERTRGRVAQGGGPGLVVVDAGFQGRTLDAETSLSGAVSLFLVDPDELVDATSARDCITGDCDPRLVLRVIVQLLLLGTHPHLARGDSLGVGGRRASRIGAKSVAEGGDELRVTWERGVRVLDNLEG